MSPPPEKDGRENHRLNHALSGGYVSFLEARGMERFKQKQNIEPESEQTLETKGVAILQGYPPHLICTQFQKSHNFLRPKKNPPRLQRPERIITLALKFITFRLYKRSFISHSLGIQSPCLKEDWGVQSPPKRKVLRFHETIVRR